MNDREIEQRFHLMHKEFEASATRFKDAKAEMAAAIDARELRTRLVKGACKRAPRSFRRHTPKSEKKPFTVNAEWIGR